MFSYILTGECFISDTTIGYPTCHLCSKFYVQFIISSVKSRQISNIHTQINTIRMGLSIIHFKGLQAVFFKLITFFSH